MMKPTVIAVNQLHIARRLRVEQATFSAGQLHFVVGQNGAGKSTLLQALAGTLEAPVFATYKNTLSFNQQSLPEYQRWSTIRGVYSTYETPLFDITVSQVFEFVGLSVTQLPEPIEAALSIHMLLQKRLQQCSQGEIARVHLARVLLSVWSTLDTQQGVLLLDEPLNHLDLVYQGQFMQLLEQLAQDNLVLLSTHDVPMLHYYPTHQLTLIANANLLYQGDVQDLWREQSSLLRRTFGIDDSHPLPPWLAPSI